MDSLKGLHNPSLVEFHPIDEAPEIPASHNVDLPDTSSNGSSRTLETQPQPRITQKRGEIPRRETSIKRNRTLPEQHKDTITVHDKKILSEIRPPVGVAGLLGKVGPLTNSWESFTRPIEMSDRSREDNGDIKVSDKPQDKLRQLNCEPQFPDKRDLSEPTIHYEVLLKSLGLKQKKTVLM